MISKTQRANAERIAALSDAFGNLPYNAAGQTPDEIFNLSIPTARLIIAGVVTAVVDTCDGVNDNAVADMERVCTAAVQRAQRDHGKGWWTDAAHSLGIDILTPIEW